MTEVRTIKPVIEMTVPELIERFEADIVYDAHSFRARYSRSHARKELLRRGPDTIEAIVGHLWEGKGLRSEMLKAAWSYLVCDIAREKWQPSVESVMPI